MRILLGVSGGIAAYKALELVRLATGAGHAVRVVQTPASQRFVGAASFAALTGAPVLTSEWERDPARGAFSDQVPPEHDPLSHLALVGNADVYAIAPASANTLAKLAHGLADNLLTSAALAATCPVLVAPAMNHAMWFHPATQANVATLRERGLGVVAPTEGRLGSLGEHGMGRLAEPAVLMEAIEATAGGGVEGERGEGERAGGEAEVKPPDSGSWRGLRVLVTAGGTREPIDAVRFVGNRSSGLMGWALADEAHARGAAVTVVAANVALPRTTGVRYVEVGSAAELQAACAEAFGACDVLLMAAAVADFRPAEPVGDKLKKADRTELVVRMEPTADVLAGLSAARRPEQLLVGFAAETGEQAVHFARDKLSRKGLDLVVVNDVARAGIGFDTPDNAVTLVSADGDEEVPRSAKSAVAAAILSRVERMRSAAGPRVPR